MLTSLAMPEKNDAEFAYSSTSVRMAERY